MYPVRVSINSTKTALRQVWLTVVGRGWKSWDMSVGKSRGYQKNPSKNNNKKKENNNDKMIKNDKK